MPLLFKLRMLIILKKTKEYNNKNVYKAVQVLDEKFNYNTIQLAHDTLYLLLRILNRTNVPSYRSDNPPSLVEFLLEYS